MSNAVEARKVVFELFQDLDGFRLDDYKALGESKEGMDALIDFISEAAKVEHGSFSSRGDKLFVWTDSDSKAERLLTTERETSLQQENVELIGLDHPIVAAHLLRYRDVPPEELGVCVMSPDGSEGVLAAWAVEARGDKGHVKRVSMWHRCGIRERRNRVRLDIYRSNLAGYLDGSCKTIDVAHRSVCICGTVPSIGTSSNEARFMCFGCGIEYGDGELKICDDCGEPCYSEERFAGKCRDCWNSFVARDNT